jgi:dTDP-4-dehydrorhamnose reductase
MRLTKPNYSTIMTGGHGLLGKKLREHFPDAYCPTHDELDIQMPLPYVYSLEEFNVIHCAAVKTTACDDDPRLAMKTNILGTVNVTEFCHKTQSHLTYISTDYVFKGDRGNYKTNDEVCPQNYYAETKLAGEFVVKSLPKDKYLIIRLSFFPDEWPYPGAFTDQWTTRVPVTKAAAEIAELIKTKAYGIHHICGPKQTVYDYAISTANGKEIKPMKLADDAFNRPRDTSLIHDNQRN